MTRSYGRGNDHDLHARPQDGRRCGPQPTWRAGCSRATTKRTLLNDHFWPEADLSLCCITDCLRCAVVGQVEATKDSSVSRVARTCAASGDEALEWSVAQT
jgi:hypothetical protein